MEPIRTRKQLEELIKFLDDQGFGYLSEYDLHQKKINSIISRNNTLNVDAEKNHKFREKLMSMKDYDEANKEAKEYFSKFSADDKILELLNIFWIQSDDSGRVPYSRSDNKEIVNWVNFKVKYGLKDEYQKSSQFTVYNFDKSFIKVRFPEYGSWNFKNLYELIFNERCDEFEERKAYGKWQNIGKIEIKLFQNGYCNIKGDIGKLKTYYYKFLKEKEYYRRNIIFIVNKKKEIIPQSDQ